MEHLPSRVCNALQAPRAARREAKREQKAAARTEKKRQATGEAGADVGGAPD